MQQQILQKQNLPDNHPLLFGNGLIKFTSETTLVEHLKT
jgi:hypothetical protein